MTGLAIESQSLTYVDIDAANLGDIGVFDTRDGGELDSDVSRHKPAALPEEILAGTQTTGNITVSRVFRRERDRPLLGPLAKARGRATATITVQYVDRDENPYGNPVVYTGLLKAATPPGQDSSSSDPASLELEFEINAEISA